MAQMALSRALAPEVARCLFEPHRQRRQSRAPGY